MTTERWLASKTCFKRPEDFGGRLLALGDPVESTHLYLSKRYAGTVVGLPKDNLIEVHIEEGPVGSLDIGSVVRCAAFLWRYIPEAKQ